MGPIALVALAVLWWSVLALAWMLGGWQCALWFAIGCAFGLGGWLVLDNRNEEW